MPVVNHDLAEILGMSVADLNGDGKNELVVGLSDYNNFYTDYQANQVTIFAFSPEKKDYDLIYNRDSGLKYEYALAGLNTGDIDNDGKAEVVFFANGSYNIKIIEYENDAFVYKKLDKVGPWNIGAEDFSFEDLDLDGRLEIVGIDSRSISIIKCLSAGQFQFLWDSHELRYPDDLF